MSKPLRIVFMGTPDFSVPTLKALIGSRHEVVGVITSVDKRSGRGRKVRPSAVKACALENELPVLQPPNLKAVEFQESLRNLAADLQVVVAFRMLPEAVWDMPPMGTLNLHASLLPDYRGAAPINWAIINGETETGLTTFLLQHEIDTGNLIFQKKMPITADETAGSLHDKMMEAGAGLVLKTVEAIADDNYVTHPQDLKGNYPNAPKLNSVNTSLDWNRSALELHHLIKGLSPYPAAWTELDDKRVKIFKSRIVTSDELPPLPEPGYFLKLNRLVFKTGDGILEILELQMEGKRRMSTEDFLRGYQSGHQFN